MKPNGPNPNQINKGLPECDNLVDFLRSANIDPPQQFCSFDKDNQNNVPGDMSWLEDELINQKTGLGHAALCDPAQTGQIINDQDNPQRNVIYKYTKAIDGCDEAVMDLFRNVVVLDEDGNPHPVPIIWATQERAVAAVVQDNFRKDDTGVVDRIRLPMMAISSTNFSYNLNRYTYHQARNHISDRSGKPAFTAKERYERDTVFGVSRGIPVDIGYTMYAWTMYQQDMNQILEQVFAKFSPHAYIRVRGVAWEILVKLDSTANNINTEPGDQALRVMKFQFNITAESYIPQPIVRNKAVLKTRIEVVDGLNEDEVTQVIGRLEEAVKELEQ